MEAEKTLIDCDYDKDPWEVDETPESVVLKVEAAKAAGKAMVELVENHRSGRRIWIALETIMAIYGPEDEADVENARNARSDAARA